MTTEQLELNAKKKHREYLHAKLMIIDREIADLEEVVSRNK